MKKLCVVLLCALVMSGCASARKLYPRFEQQNDGIRSVTVFVDSNFFQDGMEAGVIYDVDSNTQISKAVADVLAKGLPHKGYALKGVYSFAGLRFMPDVEGVRVKGGESAPESGVFYVDDFFAATGGSIAQLKEVVREVATTPEKKKPDEPNELMQSAVLLREHFDSDAYLFLLAGGINTGFMKQLGQGLFTGIATLGHAYGYNVGQKRADFCFIEAATGEQIWRSTYSNASSGPIRWVMADLARAFVGELPAK